jgi:putative nucleotidyltransferase with HDIG domain
VADPISRQPFDKSTSRLLTSIGRELGILADRVLAEQAQKTSMVNTIRALVESLEAKAPYFRGHSERVAEIGVGLAGKLGFDDSEVTLLRNASYLHDVGKIGIPDRILHKEGRLSEEEMAVVREHPALGAELVRHFDFLEPSRPLIRHHHERWDGQGYPDGLAEHAIPALAAVITIADAYDAMLSARPYRRELTRDVARRELLRSAGSQFRPDFVLAFCSRRVAAVSSPAAPTSLQEELREVERTGSEGRRILPREPLSAPPSSSDQPWITKTS